MQCDIFCESSNLAQRDEIGSIIELESKSSFVFLRPGARDGPFLTAVFDSVNERRSVRLLNSMPDCDWAVGVVFETSEFVSRTG